MSNFVRVHVYIQGRVQGVYFRQSAKNEADRLGLNGWVRNLADGRVEGVAEGSPERVDQWVAWCRKGPDNAVVNGIQVETGTPQGENAFAVLPTIR